MQESSFSASFLEAAPYLIRSRGEHFVFWVDDKLPSTVLAHAIEEIAIVHTLGANLTLFVHGQPGQKTIIDEAAQKQAATENLLHLQRCMELLSRGWVGIPERRYRMNVITGNMLQARRVGVLQGQDYGHLGSLRDIATQRIESGLKAGDVFLFGGALTGATGMPLWLPPLNLAVDYAQNMRAKKLILLTAALADVKTPVIWTTAELANQIKKQPENSFARYLLETLAQGLEKGIERIHVVNPQVRGELLQELYSRQGSGILVTQNPTATIRPLSAADVSELTTLLARFGPEGSLAPRSREIIEAALESFRVVEVDERIAACGALRIAHEGDVPYGVIEAIAVHPDFQHEGLGRKLIQALEHEATLANLTKVFVFTTAAEDWFLGLGYQRLAREHLPHALAPWVIAGRQSMILYRELAKLDRAPL